MDVFVENGFAGTKLTEVARRAGVAKGTLYLYFENKEDLFHEVFGAQSPFAPDLDTLATQHSEVVLKGILVR